MGTDYYEVLGVAKNVDEDGLKVYFLLFISFFLNLNFFLESVS
jgi:hypothetical protein